MGIEFKKQDRVAAFLNPFQNFERTETRCQIRRDPLTGRSGRLAHFIGIKPPAPDFEKIIEDSGKNCPFCPENVFTMTPKFDPDEIPEGRLEKGESVLFPNLLPYDAHSALAVLCSQHYKRLSEFTPGIFTDAFANCRNYLDRVIADKNETYGLVTWNYMPAAGSSQVHPHLQVYAGQTPGNFPERLISSGQEYYREHGRPYWEDYLAAETHSMERFVTSGDHTTWLTDFVSLSALTDVIAIFPERQTLFDLDAAAMEEAARILDQVLKYLDEQGVYSLNMAWLPALQGQNEHWLQLRISPRMYMAPHVWCTETPSLVYQYQESFMIWSPEETAGQLREFIRQASG